MAAAYGQAVPAADLTTVRDVALAIVTGAVVLAVVFAVVIRWVVGKLVTVLVLGSLAAVVWWQRETLQECAGDVGQTLAAGASDATTCTFFGRDVTVPSPRG